MEVLRILLALLASCVALRPSPRLQFRLLSVNTEKISTSTQLTTKTETTETTTELNKVIGSLTEPQKYELVMQSYGVSILDSGTRNSTALASMRRLYREMVERNAKPSRRSAGLLLDAAASFCSSEAVSSVFKLFISSGQLRTFGVGIGRLSTPALSEAAAPLEAVPRDDREREVLYAAVLGGLVGAWGALEVVSFFSDVADAWSFWLVMASAGLVGANVYLRGGQELRMAAAGLDRLTLRDPQREGHCESAAFLAGYTMGLPCFCFRPDVLEALRMLRDCPGALDAYKQPLARPVKLAAAVSASASSQSLSSQNFFQAALGALGGKSSGAAGEGSGGDLVSYSIPEAPTRHSPEADVFSIGRVLVWLMAPVAAEKLKYGKSVLSDARRSRRFLESLTALREEARDKLASGSGPLEERDRAATVALSRLPLPESAADQEALLRWAYFEASGLVRQYGDLLEELRGYLETGTASASECVFLLEDELQ